MLYSPQAVPLVFDTAGLEEWMWREGRLERKLVWCVFKVPPHCFSLTHSMPLELFIKLTCICLGWDLSDIPVSSRLLPQFTHCSHLQLFPSFLPPLRSIKCKDINFGLFLLPSRPLRPSPSGPLPPTLWPIFGNLLKRKSEMQRG